MQQLAQGLPRLVALDLAHKEAKEQEEAYVRANRCVQRFVIYDCNLDRRRDIVRREGQGGAGGARAGQQMDVV